MSEYRLQFILGLVLVVSHAIAILLCIYLYFDSAILFDNMVEILAIISPVFAIYTSAVVTSFTSNKYKTVSEGVQLNLGFVIISFLFPLLYFLLVISTLIVFGYSRLLTFIQTVSLIGIAEASFAIYSAKIIGSLYKERVTENNPI